MAITPLVVVSVLVTITDSGEVSVTDSEVKIPDEIVAVAALVDGVSVSLGDVSSTDT